MTSELDMSIKAPFDASQTDYSTLLSSSALDMVDWSLSNEEGLISEEAFPATPSVSTAATPGSSNDELSPICIRSATHNFDFSSPSPKPRSAKPNSGEDELVRKIHHKVGGPSKLSTYEEPSKVRRIVIEALASEQVQALEADRIRRGQLTAAERRVVRTVTNRGAAVRSRMRQRREMTTLREQVRARDGRVKQLEAVVRALCSAYAVPLPSSIMQPASSPLENPHGPICSTNADNPTNQNTGEPEFQAVFGDGKQSSNKFLNLGSDTIEQPMLSASLENFSHQISWVWNSEWSNHWILCIAHFVYITHYMYSFLICNFPSASVSLSVAATTGLESE